MRKGDNIYDTNLGFILKCSSTYTDLIWYTSLLFSIKLAKYKIFNLGQEQEVHLFENRWSMCSMKALQQEGEKKDILK
jgi:hypothetical protein